MSGLNASVWFPVLAGIAVKSTAIVLIAGIAALLARRWSASARHVVWTAAAAALLALPLFALTLPAIPVRAPRALLADFAVAARVSPSPAVTHLAIPTPTIQSGKQASPRTFDWGIVLTLIWALGSLVALTQMLTACAGMRRLRRRAEPSPDQPLANDLARTLGISHPVDVLETGGRSMPMTFGTLHPAIFMPESARSWTPERRRVVLLHELAHVRRGDMAMHLLARLAVILNWWNPLAWIAWRQLVKESERAADDLVLNAGTRPTDYAGHLLEVARMMQGMPLGWAAAPMARRSQLEGRLRAILDSRVNRRSAGRAAAFTAAAIAAVLVLPLAALRAQDSSAKPPRPDVDATIRSAVAQSNFQMLDSAAGVFTAERDYDIARKLLDASLSIRQKTSTLDYGVGLINIGDLEKRRGRLADAAPFYSKAAQKLGNQAQASRALIGLGIVALHAKNSDQAMSYFQSAQRLDPSQAGRAWMWMAVMREREHNAVEAEAMYQSAMAVAPPDSPDAATIMDLYARFLTGNGRQAEAQPLLDRAKALQSHPRQLSPGAYKIGGAVSAPKIITKVEPEYTEEARLAKYQGTAVLSVEIGRDGVPRNVQVVRGLGLGLDDNAVAAVSTWRFDPGTKDGGPVTVAATIEVNFKLM